MKTGERCKKAPIRGGTICSKHGGRAPHIKAAAKRRLEEASDRLAKQLLGMAEDPKMAPAVKLAALKDALDRAGLSPRQALDVSHELTPFQELLEKIQKGPAPQDFNYRPEGADPHDDRFGDIVDAEIVDDDPYADNALDPDTGRVHCEECGLPFPTELPPTLSRYPKVCAECREEIRAEKAAERKLDAEIGATTGSRPPQDPMRTKRAGVPAPAPQPDRTPGRNPRYPLPDPRY